MTARPGWSSQFAPDALAELGAIPHLDDITPEWAWGGTTGKGVSVAVVDSGIDPDHPAVAGGPLHSVAIEEVDGGTEAHEVEHGDLFGHGTACAGIIRSIAPECAITSIRVLGENLSGTGSMFISGLRWAIEHDMQVCNLSLGSTKKRFYNEFHELADDAYFNNTVLVAAANNMPAPSYPSTYASVVSVGSHDVPDPYVFYYNPTPPVEFGALGIDVNVAWLDGQTIQATGNSFAAPHMAGIIARIVEKHPDLTPFQIKTVLRALAANVQRPSR